MPTTTSTTTSTTTLTENYATYSTTNRTTTRITTITTQFNAIVTWEEFQRAFILTDYPIPSVRQYENFVKNAEPSGNITTKRELAMFLGFFNVFFLNF